MCGRGARKRGVRRRNHGFRKRRRKLCFAYFEIDGTKYYDKTLNFTIKSENTKINAVFLKRLSKPEISFDGRRISVAKGENAESCEIFFDGEFLFNTTSDKTFSLADYNVSDGAHNVLVKVSGDGFGENESAININYVRPYDTPKNVGMLIEEDKVYFVFQQVLAASGYEIFMNGQKVETPLDKKASGGSILIRVDTLFTENGTYAFPSARRATGPKAKCPSRRNIPSKARFPRPLQKSKTAF